MSKRNYFNNRPKLPSIDIDRYLQRIGLTQQEPTLSFLKSIHKNHFLYIPIENLEIHTRNKLSLEIEQLYTKIIVNKRGGINLELNTILYHLLVSLGFDTTLIAATPTAFEMMDSAFGHMLLVVKMDERSYLLDVGLPGLFIEPKEIIQKIQLDYNRYFHFEKDIDDYWTLRKSHDNSQYQSIYSFSLNPVEIIQFYEALDFYQAHPDSIHKNQKFIYKRTPEGEVTLTDRMLVTNTAGEQKELQLSNSDEYDAKLYEYFHYKPQNLFG